MQLGWPSRLIGKTRVYHAESSGRNDVPMDGNMFVDSGFPISIVSGIPLLNAIRFVPTPCDGAADAAAQVQPGWSEHA